MQRSRNFCTVLLSLSHNRIAESHLNNNTAEIREMPDFGGVSYFLQIFVF